MPQVPLLTPQNAHLFGDGALVRVVGQVQELLAGIWGFIKMVSDRNGRGHVRPSTQGELISVIHSTHTRPRRRCKTCSIQNTWWDPSRTRMGHGPRATFMTRSLTWVLVWTVVWGLEGSAQEVVFDGPVGGDFLMRICTMPAGQARKRYVLHPRTTLTNQSAARCDRPT